MYNPFFFEQLCPVIKQVIPDFHERRFLHRVFDTTWPDLELKQRTRHVTKALGNSLPAEYAKAVEVILSICQLLRDKKTAPTYPYIFLPDFIELYGLNYFDLSIRAIEEATKLVSAEFAVRPFIMKYPEETMKVMLKWSRHADPAVRRLSSEGCRPRLPWGMGIPELKKDPSPILPILENLKLDPSESVRRSVANNLNDIAKDHPRIALRLARNWRGISPETDRIIKHGCRTLLKSGNSDVLTLHGFNPNAQAQIKNLILPKRVRLGELLSFKFRFMNREKKSARYRIDYAIDYLTKTGKISRKVFKLAENNFRPGEEVLFIRNKSFQDYTTRKHFQGRHYLRILVNGMELASSEFLVIPSSGQSSPT